MHEPFITVTYEQARTILRAKALEQAASGHVIQSAVISKATAHRLGESADEATYLTERAKAVLQATGQEDPASKTPSRRPSIRNAAGLLFLAAFILGALTDKLASPEPFINLLSFPFWGVIAWNVLIYGVLLLGAVGLISPDRFPVRGTVSALLAGKLTRLLHRTSPNAALRAEMAQLLVPVYENQAAYLMHLAALAFALGLIAEIAFRGISTAFVVGWESTWFAQNPEAVKTFIDWTYGLIPFGGNLPDASTLEAMQSDRLVFRMHPVNAAPWLIRMMVLLTVFVIIPRLFLALISFSAARFCRNRLRLTVSDPYFVSVLTEGKESAHLGPLVIIADKAFKGSDKATLDKLSLLWGNPKPIVNELDYDAPPFVVPDIFRDGENPFVLILSDALKTPEEELAGALFSAINNPETEEKPFLCAVLLDTRRLRERFDVYPGRLTERIDTWTRFAASFGLTVFVYEGDAVTLVRNMRQWASTRSPVVDRKTPR